MCYWLQQTLREALVEIVHLFKLLQTAWAEQGDTGPQKTYNIHGICKAPGVQVHF